MYDQRHAIRSTPIVALNRDVAVRERDGAAAGLDALTGHDVEALADYQPYHAARADLLACAGGRDEALLAYDRAIELSGNPTERDFLARQRTKIGGWLKG